MYLYDPVEVAERTFAKGTVSSRVLHSAPYKENTMFDKNAQRQRAAELSQNPAAQGQTKPVLAPIAAPVKKGPVDKRGKVIAVGQEVVRAIKPGNSPYLEICKVTRVEGDNVYLDNSPRALNYPSRILVL